MSAPPAAPASCAPTLAVSVVTYLADQSWLKRTLVALRTSLLNAFDTGSLSAARITLVCNDHGDATRAIFARCFDDAPPWLTLNFIVGYGNTGYGRANNLALKDSDGDFLLVLNPDVAMATHCLPAGLAYLHANAQCAMVTPVSTDEGGALQSLVKGPPNVLTLALRGFAPPAVQNLFAARLRRYERAEVAFDAPLTDAVIVSGCFMLMRRAAWERAGGFDPAFFLYFEDFDLSRRVAAHDEIHRVPACRIVHGGGQASRKGWRHINLFVRSAARFFSKHGWRWV